MKLIDFRSDTVTRPDEAMRTAMYEAEVGDVGYGDDPTVNELERLAAEMTGHEASLFTASGVMGNLVALLTHCRRGEAAILGKYSHSYRYEGGGLSALGGILPYVVDDSSGIPSPEDILSNCPIVNVHFAPARLLCLENTHNNCGGVAVSPETFGAAVDAARKVHLAVHLDGARIFNAAAAWSVDVRKYTSRVDSVQFCLSKGLGAPMGSMLCGSSDFIKRARFERKRVGGELRQAGIMAAGGLYALRHNVGRLKEDHENAVRLRNGLAGEGFVVEKCSMPTNMVYFGLPESLPDSAVFAEACEKRGLLFNALEPRRIRLVTHLGIDGESVDRAVGIILEEANRNR